MQPEDLTFLPSVPSSPPLDIAFSGFLCSYMLCPGRATGKHQERKDCCPTRRVARLRAGSRNREEPGFASVQAGVSTGTGKGRLHFCVLCSTGSKPAETKPALRSGGAGDVQQVHLVAVPSLTRVC